MPAPASDFRSDTVTRPTDEMRRAMAEAEVGDDVFGDDPTVQRLERVAAETFGKEAALFVPSGTMANQIGVKALTQPGDEVLVDERAHVFLFEGGALGLISGVQARLLRGERGHPSPDAVEEAVRSDNIHHPRTRLLGLENTHNMAGGTVMPLAQLKALRAVAKKHGLAVYLDGARIFNAAVAARVLVSAYAAEVDLISCCLSKALGAPVGSLLMGARDLIATCRRIRKALGGGMRQVGVLAAPGLIALQEMPKRLERDHARARTLAQGLARIAGFTVDPSSVETNIVMVDVAGGRAAAVAARFAEQGVLVVALGAHRIRFVTHHQVGEEDVARALEAAAKVAR